MSNTKSPKDYTSGVLSGTISKFEDPSDKPFAKVNVAVIGTDKDGQPTTRDISVSVPKTVYGKDEAHPAYESVKAMQEGALVSVPVSVNFRAGKSQSGNDVVYHNHVASGAFEPSDKHVESTVEYSGRVFPPSEKAQKMGQLQQTADGTPYVYVGMRVGDGQGRSVYLNMGLFGEEAVNKLKDTGVLEDGKISKAFNLSVEGRPMRSGNNLRVTEGSGIVQVGTDRVALGEVGAERLARNEARRAAVLAARVEDKPAAEAPAPAAKANKGRKKANAADQEI